MPCPRATNWIVAAVAAMVLLPNLGAAPLWDDDEPLNAACSLAMRARGDWVVPTFNGRLRVEKPALVNWLHLAGFAVAGVNEHGARLGSALLTIGSCLLTADIGRRLFDPTVGRWAGIVMATFLWTGIAGRAATPDAPLGFFTTLALAAFVRGLTAAGGERPVRLPLVAALLTGLAAGGAMLAKGPVGLVLPLAALSLFAWWSALPTARAQGGPAPWLAAVRSAWHGARLGTIAATAVGVAAPWYAAVTLRTDGEWLHEFLLVHNVGRFAAPMEGHSGSPLLYYPAVLLVGSFPWSSGWIPAALHALRVGRTGGPSAGGVRLLAAWLIAWVVPLCVSGTKLPGYVWPAYPALACLTGLFVSDWVRRTDVAGDRWMRLGWVCLAVSGLALAIGLPVAAGHLSPGTTWTGLVGLVPVGGAAGAWLAHAAGERRRAAVTWAATAVATVLCLVGVVPAAVSRDVGVRQLVDAVHGDGATPLVLYRAPPSAVFYAGRHSPHGRVPAARTPEALADLLATHAGARIVVDARFADSIAPILPTAYRVLRTATVLPSRRRLLLIGPEHALAAATLTAHAAAPHAPP
jgi:4-amino-4-deoxy-L-arabinose transferase-like glycosyltransferase